MRISLIMGMNLLANAKAAESVGEFGITDLLIKTASIELGALSLDHIFDEELKAYSTVYEKYKDAPQENFRFYTIYSSVIGLFIREQLQTIFESLSRSGMLNPDQGKEKIRNIVKDALRIYIQKRSEIGLPNVNQSFLENAVSYAFNIAMGFQNSTPAFEDRRHERRDGTDRRASDRNVGNLEKLQSIFYQGDIEDEDTYMDAGSSRLFRYSPFREDPSETL